jgi:hypothetical protein
VTGCSNPMYAIHTYLLWSEERVLQLVASSKSQSGIGAVPHKKNAWNLGWRCGSSSRTSV